MGLLRSLFILTIMLILSACSNSIDDGSVDRQGKIVDVDEKNKRVLIDDTANGPIWVDISRLPEADRFHVPLEVTVWLKGIVKESDPQEGEAEKMEIVK